MLFRYGRSSEKVLALVVGLGICALLLHALTPSVTHAYVLHEHHLKESVKSAAHKVRAHAHAAVHHAHAMAEIIHTHGHQHAQEKGHEHTKHAHSEHTASSLASFYDAVCSWRSCDKESEAQVRIMGALFTNIHQTQEIAYVTDDEYIKKRLEFLNLQESPNLLN